MEKPETIGKTKTIKHLKNGKVANKHKQKN